MLKSGITEIPTARIVVLAKHLGGQNVTACPPVEHECWLKRDLMPYLPEVASPEVECSECWMRYLLMGD